MGDPLYEKGPQASKGSSLEIAANREYGALRGKLKPLPRTLEECRNVEQAVATGSPSADVLLLSGLNATEKNVRAHIHDRRFVHLAAHGAD